MAEEATILQTCECDSNCTLSMQIPVSEAQENAKIPGHVIIIFGCKNGASPGDMFLKEREGYALYTEAQ